jgi:hypothetical protein
LATNGGDLSVPYIKRPDLDNVINELADLFDGGSIDPELVANARAFLSNNKFKIFRIVLRCGMTDGADKICSASPRFEPSDLLLRLIAAVRTNDRDQFAVFVHSFAPSDSTSLG